MYTEYITKLNKFIKGLDMIKRHIRKMNFKPNYSQIGWYERCVINYSGKVWNEKHIQYIQAY